MPTKPQPEPEPGIERLLEQLLIAWLPGRLPTDTTTRGRPVEIVTACTFTDAGVLTHGLGVHIELSDGSAYLLPIQPYRHAGADATGPQPLLDPVRNPGHWRRLDRKPTHKQP